MGGGGRGGGGAGGLNRPWRGIKERKVVYNLTMAYCPLGCPGNSAPGKKAPCDDIWGCLMLTAQQSWFRFLVVKRAK